MTNPIHLVGLAGSALNGITGNIAEIINNKENQRTARLQTKMETSRDCVYCLQQVIAAYEGYQKVANQERTKRRNIEACEKKTLAEIQMKRDLLIGYLERSFDERAKNFEALFQLVDQAIVSDDNHQLGSVLHAIVELAKTSPFKDLDSLSAVQAALNNPDHVWEL